MQGLLNHFDVRHGGRDVIERALQCMTEVAQRTNEMKRKHEHAVRIQEVQALLVDWSGNDLTTYGELLAEESFRLLGAKASRQLLLFEKVLIVCKKKEGGFLQVKDFIEVSHETWLA